jgi:hypothetical protein
MCKEKIKKVCITFVFTMIMMFALPINASAYSYTFQNCPNSGSYVGSNYNYTKAYNNHKYYPGDNYKAWVDVSGGRYYIYYESWTCSLCGHAIAKETVMDVSTPASVKETDEVENE